MLIALIVLSILSIALIGIIITLYIRNSKLTNSIVSIQAKCDNFSNEALHLQERLQQLSESHDNEIQRLVDIHSQQTVALKSAHESELDRVRTQMSQILSDERARAMEELEREKVRSTEAIKHEEQRALELAKREEERLRLLANDILSEQSLRLQSSNEVRMSELLQPLKENIEGFKKQISECYNSEARERFALDERIKELIETNRSIGQEAKELSTALRGNSKVQGDWGEMILESILEKSGLRRDKEFFIQETTDENGHTLRSEAGNALRPDVIVRYPDGRIVIIDSKVSLKSFVDYVNCEDNDTRQQAGEEHIASVRRHVIELSEKDYQNNIGDVNRRIDFVLMFIPNEGAYMTAMNLDTKLWQWAYDKRVLIVSPTHLISVLRIVEMLWSRDRQTRNSIEIAEKSGLLYDKFVGLYDDLDKIYKLFDQTRKAFDSSLSKLSTGKGNLIKRAEELRALGVKTKKQLSVDSDDDDEQTLSLSD